MKKLLLLSCYVFISSFSFGQNEANIWCFGVNAGLDFSSGSPVSFGGVVMNQQEGCASICDGNGSLLFYTDGTTVRNANHQTMPNGYGLKGNYSTTQSAIIVKQPGSSTLYYIVTPSEHSVQQGLNYSIVDMTLQGGLGDVTVKNSALLTDCDERVAAALHSNGTDIWIITTTDYTDSVKTFLLTNAGVSPNPVVSFTGMQHPGNADDLGYLKSSPKSDHLAVAVHSQSYELYDFDNATGLISSPVVMSSPNYAFAYGVEFSPDGTRLYGSSYGRLYQFDLMAGSAADIINSATLIASSVLGGLAACLQLGPDKKIYLALEFNNYLDVISDPNELGIACNFIDVAVPLTTGTCMGGLPNYCSSLFAPPVALFSSPNQICPGACINFFNSSINGNAYQWSFPGGTPGTSTAFNPSGVCYTNPGTYDVTLIASNANGSDTLTLQNYINVYPHPAPQSITQTGDTLFAIAGSSSYQWYFNGNIISGATDYFYVATQNGDYNVVATDTNGCEVEAVINNVLANAQSEVGNLQLAIFPNPISDIIYIRGLGTNSADEVSIYNVVGEKVFSAVDCKLPITNCQLSSGMYYIEINKNNITFRSKFMKQ